MKESDKEIFNRNLRGKFKDAKFEPSSAVWGGIEADLLRAENKKMRKKALWYRNIAAAVILVAFVSLYFNIADRASEGFIGGENFQSLDLSSSEIISFNSKNTAGFPTIVNDVLVADKTQKRTASIGASQKVLLINNTDNGAQQMVEQNNVGLKEGAIVRNENRTNESLAVQEARKPSTNDKLSYVFPEVLEQVSFFAISEIEKSESTIPSSFQANVLFGSGNFNPNASVTEGNSVLSTAIVSNTSGIASRNGVDDVYNERQTIEDLSNAPMRSNLSLTYGLNFGFNIGKRMLIKSGLTYGNFRSTSESSAVLRDLNSNELFPYHGASSAASAAEGKVINITSSYNLYNDFEILSVPVQFSYKIIDSKFDIALMTGATADFLLSNAITGASDQLNTITFSQQERSAYRDIFASGIVGVELSYELGKHYGISLTPQYKKALTDVTSTGVGFSSTPAFASVNMSFQYIF